MMNNISITAFTNLAETPNDITRGDRNKFLEFYTNGQPNTIYVPMADFLAWKGVKVKSSTNKDAPVSSKSWTLAYREIATTRYNNDSKMIIKKSVNEFLLFDLDLRLIGS